MRRQNFYFIWKWLDRLVKIDETDQKVEAIKQETKQQVDQTTSSLKEVGHLQRLVLKKTTSYYIGRAMGSVK